MGYTDIIDIIFRYKQDNKLPDKYFFLTITKILLNHYNLENKINDIIIDENDDIFQIEQGSCKTAFYDNLKKNLCFDANYLAKINTLPVVSLNYKTDIYSHIYIYTVELILHELKHVLQNNISTYNSLEDVISRLVKVSITSNCSNPILYYINNHEKMVFERTANIFAVDEMLKLLNDHYSYFKEIIKIEEVRKLQYLLNCYEKRGSVYVGSTTQIMEELKLSDSCNKANLFDQDPYICLEYHKQLASTNERFQLGLNVDSTEYCDLNNKKLEKEKGLIRI